MTHHSDKRVKHRFDPGNENMTTCGAQVEELMGAGTKPQLALFMMGSGNWSITVFGKEVTCPKCLEADKD